MMKAATPYEKNMQNGISSDAAVSSPVSASKSFMRHVAPPEGERSNSGNKSGDTALTSLWLRRFKPVEEPESLKRDKVQHSHATNLDLDSSSGTHLFGSSLLQEGSIAKGSIDKALSKVGRKRDEKRAVKRDLSKQHSWSEQQYAPLTTRYTSGFDQGVADNRQDRILPDSMIIDMDVDTRHASKGQKKLQPCSPHAVWTPAGSNAVRLQAADGGIPASSLQKPPLPPSHNKSAFSQQPVSHKSPSFSMWSASKVSPPPASYSSKLLATPSQNICRHPSHIASVHENLPACQAKAHGMGCQLLMSKETMSSEPVTHLPISYHEHLPKPYLEHNSFLTCEPPKKSARQDFEAMHVIAMRTEDTKNLNNGVETGEQASGVLLKESSSIPKSLSECSVGSSHVDERMKASAGASTTASFPWEMFAGSAGPSRNAREEFVEVYNRARNELKNYKSSSLITKNFNKDVGNGHGAVSGHRGTAGEIPQEVHKAEGVECKSHPGGLEAKLIYDHLSQKQVVLGKYDCASYPEGEGKINARNTSQHAFYDVHVNNEKEVSSFMRGRGGNHVDPPAVTQRDCSLTETKYMQCRQAFASRVVQEHGASEHQEPVQSTFEAHTRRFSRDNSRMQLGRYDGSPSNRKENHMILSKRQPGMFEAGPRESLRCEKVPRKADAWLQRWYPPYITAIKGSQERRNPESIGCGQDLASNAPKVKENDEHRACGKDDVQKKVIGKHAVFEGIAPGTEPEHLKVNSSKVLPSTAAMAIVGTVAKQFCTVQPEQRGLFTFWSGFGKPASHTRDPYAEMEKRKPTLEGLLHHGASL